MLAAWAPPSQSVRWWAALGGDQHTEMLNTRYLRLLQEAADGRLRLLGVRSRVRLASSPRRAILSGSDTRSVYGRTTSTGLRHKPPNVRSHMSVTATQSNGRTAIRPFTIE